MPYSVRSQFVDKIRWPSVQFSYCHPLIYRTTTFACLISHVPSKYNTTQSSTYSTFHMTIPTWFHPPCVSKNLLPFHNSASHITTFHIKKASTCRPLNHFYHSTKAAEIRTFFELHKMASYAIAMYAGMIDSQLKFGLLPI